MKGIFVLIFLLLIGCQCTDYIALPNGDTYGIVGDSIFEVGIDTCSDVGSLLSMIKGEKITNLATSGVSVAYIISMYERLNESNPQIQTIIADGGTYNIVSGESVSEVYTEITTLFNAVISSGKSLVFMLPYHYRGDRVQYNMTVDELDSMLLSTCVDYDISCLDLREEFDTHPEYLYDSTHPTLDGRVAIVETINNYL